MQHTDTLIKQMMQLRMLMRRQYVTNHGQGTPFMLMRWSELAKSGPLTVTRIAQDSNFTLAAATQLVKINVEQGYISRHRHATDARIIELTLTPLGQSIADQVEKHMRDEMDRLATYLGEDDAEHLSRILQRVVTFVHETPGENK